MTGSGRAGRIAKVWLDFVWWIGLVGGVGIALWLVVSPLVMRGPDGSGADVEVSVMLGEGALVPRLPLESADTAVARRPVLVDARGKLRFDTRSWALQLVCNGVTLVAIGVVLWAVWLLRGFVAAVLSSEVFSAANAGRLRWLGWLLVATGIGAPALEYGRTWLVLQRTQLTGVRMLPPVTLYDEAVLAGLLVLVLAAAWRHGVELQEDRDLTV